MNEINYEPVDYQASNMNLFTSGENEGILLYCVIVLFFIYVRYIHHVCKAHFFICSFIVETFFFCNF